jgi:REP element-mobilizing transposase RayT
MKKFYLNDNYFFITCHTIDHVNYFSDDKIKQVILDRILQISKEFNFKLDAYSILLNHYHLLFHLAMGQKLKDIMKRINGRVSYEINKINRVSNQIFDKYHISNIYSENSYYKVIGYIIGNPFKHDLVKYLEELKNYEFCNRKWHGDRRRRELFPQATQRGRAACPGECGDRSSCCQLDRPCTYLRQNIIRR